MIKKKKATGVLGAILKNINDESLVRTRNKMLIASKIATAIKSKGYTQKEFAVLMGKTESEISEWLSGDRNFTVDSLTDIEIKLNITLLNVSQMSICSIPNDITFNSKSNRTTSIKNQKFYTINEVYNSDIKKNYITAIS